MFALLLSMLSTLRSALRTRADLALENLALRQQLANLRRTSGRPRVRMADRAFWLALSRLWSRWADVLVIVEPDTVVRWHRAGFRLFWRWKSRSRSPAESDVSAEVKALILQMAEANVGWGAPRIHGELLKLGIDIGQRSVSRFMPPKTRKPPSQTWRTFLDNPAWAGSWRCLKWVASITGANASLPKGSVSRAVQHMGADGTSLPRCRFRPRHIDDPGRVPWLRDRDRNAKARALSGNPCPTGQDDSLARDSGPLSAKDGMVASAEASGNLGDCRILCSFAGVAVACEKLQNVFVRSCAKSGSSATWASAGRWPRGTANTVSGLTTTRRPPSETRAGKGRSRTRGRPAGGGGRGDERDRIRR